MRTQRWKVLRLSIVTAAVRSGAPCGFCGLRLTAEDRIDVDHIEPVSVAPHRIFDRSNLRPAHASCNRSHGAAMGNRARRRPPIDPTLRLTREY